MKKTFILKASAAPFALGLALAASPVLAQDTETEEEAAAPSGGILVTGSRIARPDLEAVSPVTVLGEEQIELTGTVTLESLLNELPQIIPGATTTSNNPSGTFGTVDLRGLGPGRTLVLLNGERLPPSTTTGVVDISLIPTQLVQRVDVVSGGASAVYGSDAIAGVINFIIRDDFEGLELNGQVGTNEDGSGFEFAVGGIVGGNFADGRGNLTLSAQYFEREAISTGRYDFSRVDTATFGAPDFTRAYPVDDPSDVLPGDVRLATGGSATPPWGQIVGRSGNAFTNLSTLLPGQFAAANTDCNAATPGVPVNGGQLSFNDQGVLTPYFGSGLCGIPLREIGSSRYNFAPDNLVQLPYDRYNFTVTGNYEFSADTRLSVFAAYVESRLQQQLAPTPAGFPSTSFVIDPTITLFIPDDLQIALDSRPNPDGLFDYGYRFTSTGPRVGTIESRNVNLRTILEHDISEDWTANLVASWGRNALDSRAVGNINRVAVEQGITGCRNSTGVVNGPGVLPGCIPVNIFGPNVQTPEMVRFIQTDTLDISRFEQTRVAVNLVGSLFDLPGGPIGVAVGAEVRNDTGLSIPDDAKIRGEIIGFNAAAPQQGGINVKEVYGEIRLPLLGGSGGFPDLLAVEAGARYSDYDTIGGLFNWKVGAEFAPVDWVRFRGSFNKAARAPNVQELFQGGDQSFPGYTDPCNDNALRDAAELAQCVATTPGATPALFAGFQQPNTQVQAFLFGDPTLSEERAETFTVGAVLTPDFIPGRFSMTVDYYDIKLEGAIQRQGAGFYLNDCIGNAVQASCDRIVRNPASGAVVSIDLGLRNNPDEGGPFIVAGIDVGLDWRLPLDMIFGGASDWTLNIQNIYSYLDKYEIGGTNFVGTTFGGGFSGVASQSRNTLTLGLQNETLTAQVRWIHSDGANDALPAAFDITDADGNLATGFETPSLDYADLSLRFRVNDMLTVTAIVNNITDERPVQTTAFSNEQSGTAASYYAPIFYGRGYTISTSVRF